eukprot:7565268-Alexandrium_andersonii.AAC.1
MATSHLPFPCPPSAAGHIAPPPSRADLTRRTPPAPSAVSGAQHPWRIAAATSSIDQHTLSTRGNLAAPKR